MKVDEASRITRIGEALKGTGNSLLVLAGEELVALAKPYVSLLTVEEIAFIEKHDVINAIKLYRLRHPGLGLKDAKQQVEQEATKLGILPYTTPSY